MTLDWAYQPVAQEMKQVQDCLMQAITASSDPVIRQMSTCVLESGGKRLRPVLVCLCAKIASNGRTVPYERDLIQGAAAMELIHLASLIHDDVVDNSIVRRGRQSIPAQLGREVSILLGDFVYSKALRLVSTCACGKIFACVCDTLYDMCEGELSQVCRRGQWELSEQDYITMAKKKTAALFSLSCRLGAMIGQASEEVETVLRDVGLNLGIAYQIADDCRDLWTEERALGKPPGQDLRMGDVTLPLMLLRQTLAETRPGPGEAADQSWLHAVRERAVQQGAMDLSRDTARRYVDRAHGLLDRVPESDFKGSLRGLIENTVQGLC